MPDLDCTSWWDKDDGELRLAATKLSEYTSEAESAIRAELKRRRIQEPPVSIREEKPTTEEAFGIGNRYRDAYLVAKTVTDLGSIVKYFGAIIAVLIILIGAVSGTLMDIIAAALVGFIVGFVFWVGGVLVSALGQFTLTTIDVAVNTSPFGGNTEKARIMGIKMPQKSPTVS